MRQCRPRCSHHSSNPSTNGSLRWSFPREHSNMLPCRRCSPQESDMSRYRSSEQAARASRKQMAQATNSGGIAHNRHPARPTPSQCRGRRHFKRMDPGHSSDPLSRRRKVKPSLEHLYSSRRRCNSSTCPPNRRLSSSDLRNLHYNNNSSVLHSRLPNNSDPHSQRPSSSACPHNLRFKNNGGPLNLLLNNRNPHNLPLSSSDPLNPHPNSSDRLNPHHNNSAYPHSLARRRASMAVRSLSHPRPNHECTLK